VKFDLENIAFEDKLKQILTWEKKPEMAVATPFRTS